MQTDHLCNQRRYSEGLSLLLASDEHSPTIVVLVHSCDYLYVQDSQCNLLDHHRAYGGRRSPDPTAGSHKPTGFCSLTKLRLETTMFKSVIVATTVAMAMGAKPLAEDHTTFTDFEAIVKHVNQVSQ